MISPHHSILLSLIVTIWWNLVEYRQVTATKDWTFELISIKEAPIEVLSENESIPTKHDCSNSQCLDIFKCNVLDEHIRIFVYPITRFVDETQFSVSPPQSKEFQELLEAAVKSKYYTSNPDEACLFVPSVDLLTQASLDLATTSQILNSLSFWKNHGSNHLLFNMIPGSFPDYSRQIQVKTGNAIIAGGGFDSWMFRPGFDVSIPVFSPLSLSPKKTPVLRTKLIASTQFDGVSPEMKQVLVTLSQQHLDDISIFSHRCHSTKGTEGHHMICDTIGNSTSYPEVLSESTFCLLLPTAYLSSPTLSDILATGCIPVIVIDDIILPFPEKIDWARAAIRIRELILPSIFDILSHITEGKRQEMREYGHQVYSKYFSSMQSIALTTFDILNERIIPGSLKEKTRLPPCLSTNEV